MFEKNTDKVEIEEVYRNYEPPEKVRKTVERLINGIPRKYLFGLKSVVLRNASELSRKRRREKTISRKRKVSSRKSLGLYHQQRRGEQAYIELFVDNIFNPSSGNSEIEISGFFNILLNWMKKTKFFWDYRFSRTLYHEIGHHIHKTQAPEFDEREDVADRWAEKLQKRYLYRKYWYIFPVPWSLLAADRWVKDLVRKQQ